MCKRVSYRIGLVRHNFPGCRQVDNPAFRFNCENFTIMPRKITTLTFLLTDSMTRILGAPQNVSSQVLAPKQEDTFELITENDLYKADEHLTQEILYYAGYTFLAVLLFIFLVACFVFDPRAFVIAFGTGSPCCLLSPCITSLYKYTDPSTLIRESVNKYVPGIIVEDDGNVKAYEPSPEEIEHMFELINEFMTPSY